MAKHPVRASLLLLTALAAFPLSPSATHAADTPPGHQKSIFDFDDIPADPPKPETPPAEKPATPSEEKPKTPPIAPPVAAKPDKPRRIVRTAEPSIPVVPGSTPLPAQDAIDRALTSARAKYEEMVERTNAKAAKNNRTPADRRRSHALNCLKETEKIDATTRIAQLLLAYELAINLGDFTLASSAAVAIDRTYAGDWTPPFLARAIALSTNADAVQATALTLSLASVIDAMPPDRADIALKLLPLCQANAQKSDQRWVDQQIAKITRNSQARAKAFESIAPARALLATNPNDPEANNTVGRFYALYYAAWDKALPYLAKSSDPDLAPLALLDLANPPKLDDQLKLAEAWAALLNKYTAKPAENPPATLPGTLTPKLPPKGPVIAPPVRTLPPSPFQQALAARSLYWYERTQDTVEDITLRNKIDKASTAIAKIANNPLFPEAPGIVARIVTHTPWPFELAFSPDSRYILLSEERTVRVFDLTNFSLHRQTNPHDSNNVLALSPLGTTAIIGSSDPANFFRLWDYRTGKTLVNFRSGNLSYSNITFAPDGRRIITKLYEPPTRDELISVDAFTGVETVTFPKNTENTQKYCLSPDGAQLTYIASDEAFLCDALTGKLLGQFKRQPNIDLKEINYLANPRLIMGVLVDRKAQINGQFGVGRVHDLGTNKPISTLNTPTESGGGNFKFSPDGTILLYTYSSTQFKLFNSSTGKLILTQGIEPDIRSPLVKLRMYEGKPREGLGPFAFSADSRYLAFVSAADGCINIYRLPETR